MSGNNNFFGTEDFDLKSALNAIKDVKDSIQDLKNKASLPFETLKQGAEDAKTAFNSYAKEIEKIPTALKDIGSFASKAFSSFKISSLTKVGSKIKSLKKNYKSFNSLIKKTPNLFSKANKSADKKGKKGKISKKGKKSKGSKGVGGFSPASALLDIGSAVLEVGNLRNQVSLLTGASDESAKGIANNVMKIGEVYGQDYGDVLKAANTLTAKFGGTVEENLAIVKQGFEKGGGANEEFLSQIQELPGKTASAFDGASEFVGFMTNAAKSNLTLFDDDGEGINNLLDTMPGLKQGIDDVAGSSNGFQAGWAVIQELMIDVKTVMADLLLPVFETITGFINDNKEAVMALAPFLGILATAIGVVTIAQYALNLAMAISPITWIIIGVVALVAAIVYMYKKFEPFRNMINSIIEKFKMAWEWAKKLFGYESDSESTKKVKTENEVDNATTNTEETIELPTDATNPMGGASPGSIKTPGSYAKPDTAPVTGSPKAAVSGGYSNNTAASSGGSGGGSGKTVNQTLNIVQNFKIDGENMGASIEKIKRQITQVIVDASRDGSLILSS